MKKTIFLHVGNFKTGTSAIQQACHNNEKLDFYYPKSCRPERNITTHGKLSLSLMQKHGVVIPGWYNQTCKFEDVVNELIKEIDEVPQEKIVISSEEFFRVCHNKKADLILDDLFSHLGKYNVKIVAYVRDPLNFVKSWYNQVTKSPRSTLDFLNFFWRHDSTLFSQYKVITRYQERVGKSNMNVKLYGHDIDNHINDFFSIIGSKVSMDGQDYKVNLKVDDSRLELFRLAKYLKREHPNYNADLHDFSLIELENKVSNITSKFNNLCLKYDLDFKSALDINSLLDVYFEKMRTYREFVNPEINWLIEKAIRHEPHNLLLASKLLEFCSEMRPDDQQIQQRILWLNTIREKNNV